METSIQIPNDPLQMYDVYVNVPINKEQKDILYGVIASEIDKAEATLSMHKLFRLLMWVEDVVRESYYNSNDIDYLKPYLQAALEMIESKGPLNRRKILKSAGLF